MKVTHPDTITARMQVDVVKAFYLFKVCLPAFKRECVVYYVT